MDFNLTGSAPLLRELNSTIAVVVVALLIALLFQARMLDFRSHHAWQPRSVVAALGVLAAIFFLTEGAALLALVATDPRIPTLVSASGLVLIFAFVLMLVFEHWLSELRKYAEERHHYEQATIAERAVDRAVWVIGVIGAMAIVAMWLITVW